MAVPVLFLYTLVGSLGIMYKDRTQFAGQHVRVPEAVAKVDRHPAPEVDQEEGSAVGEQERRYSIVVRRKL